MRKLFPLVLALVAMGLVAAGCGGDDSNPTTQAASGTTSEGSGTTEESEASETESEGEEATASPAQAIAEIGTVRKLLAQGVAVYKGGDADQADTIVGDAYLEHFELVEGPLGQRDEHLNEELEEQIREELRGMIKSGAPAAEVASFIERINRGLDQAEKVLRS
jgi:hypothetical protein